VNGLPLLDLSTATPQAVVAALRSCGALRVRDPAVPASRCAQAVSDAAAFFARPQADKDALAIARSPHFRGYSQMHNARDWREQIHFGPEQACSRERESEREPWARLEGPNLWPEDAAWRDRMLAHLAAVDHLGQRLLSLVAQGLGLPAQTFADEHPPYLLMKLIAYHPQHQAQPLRPGVAAHLDFSWVTLTLQDETGGLEVMDPEGCWIPVDPVPGTWLVNVGELLQFATRGALVATPHRVLNRSSSRSRVSIPVFINPGLRVTVAPFDLPEAALHDTHRRPHVHHVLDPTAPRRAFVFGAAEWRRKGENRWCRLCAGASAGLAPQRG
jgi:isopenicillin N synthase-like dioxygenase